MPYSYNILGNSKYPRFNKYLKHGIIGGNGINIYVFIFQRWVERDYILLLKYSYI